MALVTNFDDVVRLHETTPEQVAAARITIADNARDAADLALLLDIIQPTTHPGSKP